jgi:hypothetical protein
MDFHRPHAVVYGTPGVRFQQNGHYYRDNGQRVHGDPEREDEIARLRDMLADPTCDLETKRGARERLKRLAPPEPVAEEVPVFEASPKGWSEDDPRRPEVKALKAQLEAYGEPFVSVKQAREFLAKGRQ